MRAGTASALVRARLAARLTVRKVLRFQALPLNIL
jgi:hypothetical protein